MFDPDTIPLPAAGVIGRLLNGENGSEAVILLPEKSQVKVLNEVGARIWSLIDGQRSVREIAALLGAEYEVEQDAVQADALSFITELAERGIVTVFDR